MNKTESDNHETSSFGLLTPVLIVISMGGTLANVARCLRSTFAVIHFVHGLQNTGRQK